MNIEKRKILKAALWYGEHGFHIFPVVPNSKRPLTANGFKDATTDPSQIEKWFTQHPRANIGLACDMSGIVALDGDPARFSPDDSTFLDELLNEYPTTAQSTPTLGAHLLYRAPDTIELSNSSGNLPPGIDIRYHGYVLLAPSIVTYDGDDAAAKGVPNGHVGEYTWLEGLSPIKIAPQPLPSKVIELLTRKPEPSRSVPHSNGYHGGESRYAQVALDDELDTLARTREGGRNDQLNVSAFSLGQLVGSGALSENEVGDRLMSVALAIGLEEREALRTIASGLKAGKQQPRGVPEERKLKFGRMSTKIDEPDSVKDCGLNVFDYRAEDGGILDAWMVHYAADWLYATGHENWYLWIGSHWQIDETMVVQRQIQVLMDTMNLQARAGKSEAKAEKDDDKEAIAKAYITATKRSKSRVGSVEGLAQQQRAIAPTALDGGNLLNLQNGTLDLDSLEFHEHDKENLLTYCLPYEYDYIAGCARFRQFISEVLVKDDRKTPDTELALLAQELVGYSLTNDTRQEVMVWLSGEGGNGKTVAITMISKLLGPLAVNMDFQMIGVAGNYDLASLPGKRVVFSTESERGGSMAEGYIKRIVSGETITARAIYGKPFSFQNTAKIWWAMNDRPSVRDTSNAMWRRLKLIPFLRTFGESEKDAELIARLTIELPGILNWAIEGLVRLRRQGKFTVAQAVGAAIEEYKYESNPVAQWLKERTEPGGETLATSAHQNYALWCTRSNNPELNSTNFGRELARLNVRKGRNRSGNFYGFSLVSV